MNTLAILGGTFGNFRPLSLTTLAWSIFNLTYHYYERTLFWTLKCLGRLLNTIQINEHSRSASGVVSVTSTTIIDYFGLVNLHLNLPLLRTRAIVNT